MINSLKVSTIEVSKTFSNYLSGYFSPARFFLEACEHARQRSSHLFSLHSAGDVERGARYGLWKLDRLVGDIRKFNDFDY
jgi:hypothetical protein